MKKITLITLILLIVFPSILLAAGRGFLLWPRTIGEDKWPLTTKVVRVYCENLGYGKKAVYLSTIKNDSEVWYEYAVNGTARGAMKQLGLREIEPIMKEGALPYHLQPFIDKGLEDCDR